jgi:hypothetical protein
MRSFLYIIYFFPILFFSQELKLSDSSQVSVITVKQGENLYDSFGHSAIRVKDSFNKLDRVYNYGTYDFNTPNFYSKFLQGKLLYDLSSYPFHYFLKNYKQENRTIIEQVLNLSLDEKQRFFDYLENNAKPENKKYLYDFFYDNCATKIRDVTANALGENAIDFKDELLYENKTFRDLIYSKLDKQPWSKFGIDLALGSVIDKKAKPVEYTFLPEYIQKSFTNATRKKLDFIPLVKETKILYKKREQSIKQTIFKPFLVFNIFAFLVLLITIKDFKNKKRTKSVDFLILFTTGILGILIVFIWFATDHSTTKWNFNVFWAILPNLFVAFTIFKLKKWHKNYFVFLLFLLLLTIIFWILKIQMFNLALIPILIMLLVRYVFILYVLKVKKS